MESKGSNEKNAVVPPTSENPETDTGDLQKEEELQTEMESSIITEEHSNLGNRQGGEGSNVKVEESRGLESKSQEEKKQSTGEILNEKNVVDSPTSDRPKTNTVDHQEEEELQTEIEEPLKVTMKHSNLDSAEGGEGSDVKFEESTVLECKTQEEKKQSSEEILSEKNVVVPPTSEIPEMDTVDLQNEEELQAEMKPLKITEKHSNLDNKDRIEGSDVKIGGSRGLESLSQEEKKQSAKEILIEEKKKDPVFDGTEIPEKEVTRNSSACASNVDPEEIQGYAWPAVTLRNFVKEKKVIGVSTFLSQLLRKRDEREQNLSYDKDKNDGSDSNMKEEENSSSEAKAKEVSQKTEGQSLWNPLRYIRIVRDLDTENKNEGRIDVRVEELAQPLAMRGRIILYTRLGCQDCREVRLLLHSKRLSYVEINIDIYPSRKLELEKNTGSNAVPKVFFNEVLVGGLCELRTMDESGKLDDLITQEPSDAAPLPPLSGEDDMSSSGTVDELAIIVQKMRETVVVKDRFYKMRRFTNCFVGSEASWKEKRLVAYALLSLGKPKVNAQSNKISGCMAVNMSYL